MSSPEPKPEERDPLVALMEAWEGDLLRGKKQDRAGAPWKPANVYASKRRRCTRAMALDMLHPEDDPFDQAIQFERMIQGNEAESAIVARLHKIGPFCNPAFTVAEQQHRFETKDRDGVLLVTGKMDGRLRFKDGAAPPFEIKSGKTYEGCETLEDFDRGPWARAAVDQLLAYLYADNPKNYPNGEPWGFIFIRRLSRFPQPVRVNLLEHLERVEAFMREARQAVDARHGRAELPDFINDAAECRRCPHLKKSCDPPMDFGPGVTILTDPILIEAAVTREATREAHEQYEAADKHLKETLRGQEMALFGDFQAIGRWSPLTTYEIPKDIKEQFKAVKEQGRFTLKIERIAS